MPNADPFRGGQGRSGQEVEVLGRLSALIFTALVGLLALACAIHWALYTSFRPEPPPPRLGPLTTTSSEQAGEPSVSSAATTRAGLLIDNPGACE